MQKKFFIPLIPIILRTAYLSQFYLTGFDIFGLCFIAAYQIYSISKSDPESKIDRSGAIDTEAVIDKDFTCESELESSNSKKIRPEEIRGGEENLENLPIQFPEGVTELLTSKELKWLTTAIAFGMMLTDKGYEKALTFFLALKESKNPVSQVTGNALFKFTKGFLINFGIEVITCSTSLLQPNPSVRLVVTSSVGGIGLGIIAARFWTLGMVTFFISSWTFLGFFNLLILVFSNVPGKAKNLIESVRNFIKHEEWKKWKSKQGNVESLPFSKNPQDLSTEQLAEKVNELSDQVRGQKKFPENFVEVELPVPEVPLHEAEPSDAQEVISTSVDRFKRLRDRLRIRNNN